MEPLNQLKRRSTDLLKQAQQNMPSMPEMPNMPSMPNMSNMPNMPALPGLPKNINIPNISKKLPSLPQFRQRRSPDDAVQATWERLDIPSLPRSSHSLDVVAGCAYIFGGELEGQQPVDNGMHVIRLPFSGAGADYYTVTAKASLPQPTAEQSDQRSEQALSQAAQTSLEEVPLQDASEDTASEDKGKEIAKDQNPELDDIPCPRAGHATAVIGSRIFLFGGRGGPDMEPLEEAGRVWAYDTRSHTWSHLDPVPAVKGGAIVPHPAPRSNHCATASDRPRDFPNSAPSSTSTSTSTSTSSRSKKPQTWRQWAIGDISKTGIPQDPVVGYVAETAVDKDSAGYGTFFVHAGCLASGDLTSDLWAFDVRTRTWTELPAAPGPVRSGSAMCISKSRLYRFGGWDGESEIGGQLDVLHLQVETFDDGYCKGEVAIQARAGWQSILQDGTGDASSTSEIHAEPSTRQEWPAPRSEASLQALTLGGGREYLVLCMGGRDTFFSDVWTFQVPPRGMTPASFTAAVYQAMGRRTGEGEWEKLRTGPHDEENTGGDGVPVGRGWLASGPMTDLEESGIVIWGGLGGNEQRMGDGWILRLRQ